MMTFGKRLVSVCLVLIVSLILVASPANADTTTNLITLTPDNFQTEVLESEKPVAVIVLSEDINNTELKPYKVSLTDFKSELQKIAGDKYKIGLVTPQYVEQLHVNRIVPGLYPPVIPFSVYQNGDRTKIDFFPRPGFNSSSDDSSFYNPLKDALAEVVTTFPNGDFRIINVETGQALYVDLGKQTTNSSYRLGNETTTTISDKPTIGLRRASGGVEEAFYFDTSEDRGERQPRFQLVSVAVNKKRNIGEYCISRNSNEYVYMKGCGTDRSSKNDWRWQTAGGYIRAADGKYNNQDKTYLSLTATLAPPSVDDGCVANVLLTLQPKGSAGQHWKFEAFK